MRVNKLEQLSAVCLSAMVHLIFCKSIHGSFAYKHCIHSSKLEETKSFKCVALPQA